MQKYRKNNRHLPEPIQQAIREYYRQAPWKKSFYPDRLVTQLLNLQGDMTLQDLLACVNGFYMGSDYHPEPVLFLAVISHCHDKLTQENEKYRKDPFGQRWLQNAATGGYLSIDNIETLLQCNNNNRDDATTTIYTLEKYGIPTSNMRTALVNHPNLSSLNFVLRNLLIDDNLTVARYGETLAQVPEIRATIIRLFMNDPELDISHGLYNIIICLLNNDLITANNIDTVASTIDANNKSYRPLAEAMNNLDRRRILNQQNFDALIAAGRENFTAFASALTILTETEVALYTTENRHAVINHQNLIDLAYSLMILYTFSLLNQDNFNVLINRENPVTTAVIRILDKLQLLNKENIDRVMDHQDPKAIADAIILLTLYKKDSYDEIIITSYLVNQRAISEIELTSRDTSHILATEENYQAVINHENPLGLAKALIMLDRADLLNSRTHDTAISHDNPEIIAQALVALNEHNLMTEENRKAIAIHKYPLAAISALVILNRHNLLTEENREAIANNPLPGYVAKALADLAKHEILTKDNRIFVADTKNPRVAAAALIQSKMDAEYITNFHIQKNTLINAINTPNHTTPENIDHIPRCPLKSLVEQLTNRLEYMFTFLNDKKINDNSRCLPQKFLANILEITSTLSLYYPDENDQIALYSHLKEQCIALELHHNFPEDCIALFTCAPLDIREQVFCKIKDFLPPDSKDNDEQVKWLYTIMNDRLPPLVNCGIFIDGATRRPEVPVDDSDAHPQKATMYTP